MPLNRRRLLVNLHRPNLVRKTTLTYKETRRLGRRPKIARGPNAYPLLPKGNALSHSAAHGHVDPRTHLRQRARMLVGGGYLPCEAEGLPPRVYCGLVQLVSTWCV
jgi:hypothetical protein